MARLAERGWACWMKRKMIHIPGHPVPLGPLTLLLSLPTQQLSCSVDRAPRLEKLHM